MDIIVGCKITSDHTVKTQQANTIDIKDCSGNTYENASTMAEKIKGIFTVINREQPN